MRMLTAFTSLSRRGARIALLTALASLTACGGGGGGGGDAAPPLAAPDVKARLAPTIAPGSPLKGLLDVARIVAGNIDALGTRDDVAFIQENPTSLLGSLVNNGAGDFINPNLVSNPFPLDTGAIIPAPSDPMALLLDDFDEDGDLDVAVAHTSATDSYLSVYLNDGNGDFSAGIAPLSPVNMDSTDTWPGRFPEAIASGDISLDTNTDALTLNFTGGGTTVALAAENTNPATGQMSEAGALASGGTVAGDIVSGDFDGVSSVDFAVVQGNALVVYLSSFAYEPSTPPSPPGLVIFVPNTPEILAVGDFDKQGGIDLVVGSTAVGEIRVFLNSAVNPGFFQPSAQSPIDLNLSPGVGIADVEVGDFDNDGNPDIGVMLNSNELVFLTNAAGGVLGQFAIATVNSGPGTRFPAVVNPLSDWRDMAVLDFNGDTCDDIAIADSGLQQIDIIETCL